MRPVSTLALVVSFVNRGPIHLATLSDETEIAILDAAIQKREENPLSKVTEYREKTTRDEEEFGNYVENLIVQPFQRIEIQEYGVAWFKSRIRLEQFQREETEAAKVVADYAYSVFRDDPGCRDFVLDGAAAKIRVRVFEVKKDS